MVYIDCRQRDVLIKGIKMTDMVKNFREGAESLGQGMQAHGFRKGAEAINLAEIFLKRNIRFDDSDEK